MCTGSVRYDSEDSVCLFISVDGGIKVSIERAQQLISNMMNKSKSAHGIKAALPALSEMLV